MWESLACRMWPATSFYLFFIFIMSVSVKKNNNIIGLCTVETQNLITFLKYV